MKLIQLATGAAQRALLDAARARYSAYCAARGFGYVTRTDGFGNIVAVWDKIDFLLAELASAQAGETVLAMNADHAEELRTLLLDAAKTREAKLGRQDAFGQRYTIDFDLEWHGKRATIRSGWIIENGQTTPRLTTCFPK